jgi:hypothetical protein
MKAQAFRRIKLGANLVSLLERMPSGKAWSWSFLITLKESSSGPKTRLGAGRCHDPKESASGQKTKLGASPFDDSKVKYQVVRRGSLERVLFLTLKKVKVDSVHLDSG